MSKRRCAVNPHWLSHYRELIGTWVRRARSIEDAQDAVHDSITKYLAGSSLSINNTRAYLHRSTNNRLIDVHRRQQLIEWVPLQELKEWEHPLQAEPDGHMRTKQLVDDLKEALLELPEKCRHVFLLHRLEGYSQKEIAARLGISVNMVERYMMQALRHLRERLRAHE